MLEIKSLGYDYLPKEVIENWQPLSNNGNGKEYAGYLVFYYKGKIIAVESDAMEPEDACFYRDLGWIRTMVLKAYQLGKEEKKNES